MSSYSNKKAHCNVPLVTIGVNRNTALETHQALINLDRANYHVVACLDFVNSPEAYRFSPQNLGVVLHALYPRPKGLVTGTAVGSEELESIKQIWDAYVENTIVKEQLGGHCWVAVGFK